MKAPKRDNNKPPVDLSLGFVEHFTLAFVLIPLLIVAAIGSLVTYAALLNGRNV